MYLDQLLCLEVKTAADGSQSKEFSLNVLLANALAFSVGFLPTYFVFADMIPGVTGGKK